MGKQIMLTHLFTLIFPYAQELREHTGLGCFKIKNKTYTHKKLKEEIKKANIIHNASGEAYTDWMRKWKASTLVNHLNQIKLGEE